MTPIEEEILEALTELDRTIKNRNAAVAKPDFQGLFRQIDLLASHLPKTADPSLLHYLHKKSYEKARLFLLGKDSENRRGNCGHV